MKTRLTIVLLAFVCFLSGTSRTWAQCSATSAPSFSGSDEDEFFTSVTGSATGGGVSTISYSFPFTGSYYGPDVTYINEYPSQGITAAPGATVTVNVTRYAYHYTAYLSIYVDWDNDGTYESSEFVGSTYTFGAYVTGPAAYTFTVPDSGVVKDTNLHMRVFSTEGGSAPCDGSYGQSMDFYLNICDTPTVGVTAGLPLICSGSSDSLYATGASSFSWEPATGLTDSTDSAISTQPMTTTMYTVTGTVPGGCSNTDTVTVNVVTTPVISAFSPSVMTLCSGDTTTLNVTDTTGSPLMYTFSGPGLADSTTASAALTIAPVDSVTGSYLYTVVATTTTGGCSDTAYAMAITVNPLPNVYTVTGTGSYCAGDTGIVVGLDSSDAGISYQLYQNDSAAGIPVSGSDSLITFGTFTTAATYIVIAANATTGCMSTMNDSAVITINPLPVPYTVSGGGAYCAGGSGSVISIDSSDPGILYSLVYDSIAVGLPLTGTGSAISFASQTVPGTYEVGAYNPMTGCIDTMTGNATISVDSIVVPVVTVTATPGLALSVSDTCTFTATVSNGGAAPAYQWYINGVAMPGATSATFTADSLLGDSISCSVTNTDMCGAADTASVAITHNLAVYQATASGIRLDLMPNPNNGAFTVQGFTGNTQDETVTLEITDMTGQSVYKEETTAPSGVISQTVHSGSTLPDGMYLLHLHSGNNNVVLHFVVKH